MGQHPDVRGTVQAYLSRASDLIDGLYLVGSIALDDYRPGHSDIDFVALVSAPPDEPVFSTIHEGLPGFDGLYLTRAELATGPLSIGPTPYAYERGYHVAGRFEHTPVAWHTLATRGVRCHGPTLDALDIWTDRAALLAYARDNLDTYWTQMLDREPFDGGVTWIVLGVPRLHYTLATGEITSKTGAGEYALRAFDRRWHPLVEACLEHRRGGPPPPMSLWPQALAFLAMVLNVR